MAGLQIAAYLPRPLRVKIINGSHCFHKINKTMTTIYEPCISLVPQNAVRQCYAEILLQFLAAATQRLENVYILNDEST